MRDEKQFLGNLTHIESLCQDEQPRRVSAILYMFIQKVNEGVLVRGNNDAVARLRPNEEGRILNSQPRTIPITDLDDIDRQLDPLALNVNSLQQNTSKVFIKKESKHRALSCFFVAAS